MDAVFLPEPAELFLDEEATGGAITRDSRVRIETDLARIPGQFLANLLSICFDTTPNDQPNPPGVDAPPLRFCQDSELPAEQVVLRAREDQILINSNSVEGFWRGAHLIVQMLGPELVTGLPTAVKQLPYLPIEIQDIPSHSTRSITLPLLDMTADMSDALAIIGQLAAIGVNQLALCQTEPGYRPQMLLPHHMDPEGYQFFYGQVTRLGVNLIPEPGDVVSLEANLCAHEAYARQQIESVLWPDAVASFAAGWVGQRGRKGNLTGQNQTELHWDLKQRIAAYSLFWAAQGIAFVDGPSFVWPWHLVRLKPQAHPGGSTLVGLLLAPGTHAHGDHVEMERGKEGIIGGGLSVTAMVNGKPTPVTLIPGHPLTDSGGTGVYQVFIPTPPKDADLRLAAIAQTNDGCSC